MVFEPVLSPDTHIGIRENGDVKKPSHTGTRKHARFTPIMKVIHTLLVQMFSINSSCSHFSEHVATFSLCIMTVLFYIEYHSSRRESTPGKYLHTLCFQANSLCNECPVCTAFHCLLRLPSRPVVVSS